MRSLHRTALSAALAIGSFMGTDFPTIAAENKSASRLVRRDNRMLAAHLEETRGHLEEAKRLYTQVHHGDPANFECCHRLGLIYAKLNRHAEAEVFYQRANAINPQNPKLLADRGYSAFQRKDYLQAEEWLEQSIKLDSSYRNAMRNLAIVRAWLNKDDSSLATFRLINEEAESLRNLGAIQIARGDKSLGLKTYELAQGINLKTALVAERNLPPVPQIFPIASVEPPKLSSEPIPVLDLAENPFGDPAPSPVPMFRSSDTKSLVTGNKIVNPLLTTGSGPKKVELVSTFARPTASMASYPVPVTAIPFERSNPFEVDHSEGYSTTPVRELAPLEDLVFELPKKVTVQNKTANNSLDPLDSLRSGSEFVGELAAKGSEKTAGSEEWNDGTSINAIPLSSEQKIDEICLVTLRDEREIVRGVLEFIVEYHGQKYHCSTPEALEKFRTDPDRYAPAAGGLDFVRFRSQREFVQGSMSHATWYRRRLYLFSSQENRAEFQQNPQKYVAAE